jgi:hypothetical protein
VEKGLPAVPGKKVGDVVGTVGCSVAWWDLLAEGGKGDRKGRWEDEGCEGILEGCLRGNRGEGNWSRGGG